MSHKQKLISRFVSVCLIFLYLSAVFLMPVMLFAQANSTTTNIAVLTAKVDLLNSLNERILNTVYWTLGILAAIFLALISVNLYFNITGNKQEIRKIRDDVLASTKANIEMAMVDITTRINTFVENQAIKIKDEILTSTESRIKTVESDITAKTNAFVQGEVSKTTQNSVTLLKNELLVYQADVAGRNETLGKQILTVNSTLDKVTSDITSLRIDLKELEAFKYSQEGKMGAIINQIELLEHDLAKRRWYLKYRLEDIRKEVEKVDLNKELFDKLSRLLGEIKESEHGQVIKGIKEHMTIK